MRRAYTLIEMLVVVGIIAVFIGLLLPSISKVRKGSARLQCLNNLKQIGLAAHNYLDTHKTFPPGTVPNADLPPDQRLAFTVALLPFLEQEKLHKAFDITAAWDAPHNAKAADGVVVPVYRCKGVEADGPDLAKIHYIGVAGIGPDAATRPVGAPGVGMFGYDRKVTLADVKDGASNTVLVAEKWLHPLRVATSAATGIDGGDNEVWANAGWDECIVRIGDGTYTYDYNGGQPAVQGTGTRTIPRTPRPDIEAPCVVNSGGAAVTIWNQQFGSSHIGGMNAVMGDGSVRIVQYSVDPAVWAATCTRAGGETLTLQ